MDRDFCLFSTRSGGRYLYDANTNTVHPVSDGLTEEVARRVYEAGDDEALNAVAEDCPGMEALFRYFAIWRAGTDAFMHKPPQPRMHVHSLAEVYRSQRNSGLAWDLILVTTEQCNMRCAYCVHEKGLYPNRRPHGAAMMSRATARRAIDLYLERNREELVRPFKTRALNVAFYGGEALLNWDVVKDGVAYARARHDDRRELHLGMTTNLTLLDEAWLPFLRDHEVFLTVSLDGPKEEHDRYRHYANGRATFDDIDQKLQAIRAFDAEYFGTYVKAAVTVNGNTDFIRVVDYFENDPCAPRIQSASRLKDLETSDFHRRHPYDESRFRASNEQLRRRFEEKCLSGTPFAKGEPLSAFQYDFMSNFYNAPSSIRYEKQWFTGVCAPGRKMLVAPDGDIHVCERIGTKRPVGDVAHGLDEKRLVDYFNAFFDSTQDCGTCWARNRCTICPAEVDSDRAGGYFEDRCDAARAKVLGSLSYIYSMLEEKPDLFEPEFAFY